MTAALDMTSCWR